MHVLADTSNACHQFTPYAHKLKKKILQGCMESEIIFLLGHLLTNKKFLQGGVKNILPSWGGDIFFFGIALSNSYTDRLSNSYIDWATVTQTEQQLHWQAVQQLHRLSNSYTDWATVTLTDWATVTQTELQLHSLSHSYTDWGTVTQTEV